MKRLSRDSWLAIGLVTLLVLITVAAAIGRVQEEQPVPMTSISSAPHGTRALWLWLQELGYPVNNEAAAVFRLPEETSVVLMLEPLTLVTPQEWDTIDDWVEQGGTLVLAGDGWLTSLAVRHYDLELVRLHEMAPALTLQTPLLASAPLSGTVDVRTRAYFETVRDDHVTHLAWETRPVVLSFEYGDGRVILSAAPFPFSNAGLKEPGCAALVLGIVEAMRRPGVIWFDEWHHGLRTASAEVVGPSEWLRWTPAGRSLLYVAAVVFVALVLQGRHLGRPVPLPRDAGRRAPVEYITAVANLNRRAGHRRAVLRHCHHRLKRGLGRRYRLSPVLPDEEYVAQLALLSPGLDADALRRLLAQLVQPGVSESDMVQLAAEVSSWLKES